MAESPGSFFVPTLDIDLAWHTRQLLARRYQKECLHLVGRYVDQYVVSDLRVRTTVVNYFLYSDDKVEEDKLATSFDMTCRTWQVRLVTIILGLRLMDGNLHHYNQDRYGVPYCVHDLGWTDSGTFIQRKTLSYCSTVL